MSEFNEEIDKRINDLADTAAGYFKEYLKEEIQKQARVKYPGNITKWNYRGVGSPEERMRALPNMLIKAANRTVVRAGDENLIRLLDMYMVDDEIVNVKTQEVFTVANSTTFGFIPDGDNLVCIINKETNAPAIVDKAWLENSAAFARVIVDTDTELEPEEPEEPEDSQDPVDPDEPMESEEPETPTDPDDGESDETEEDEPEDPPTEEENNGDEPTGETESDPETSEPEEEGLGDNPTDP